MLSEQFHVEKMFFVKYLSSLYQNTADSPRQCPFKICSKIKLRSKLKDSLFFHLFDFVAVLLICAFQFIHNLFTSLRQNFFVIDELINEGQVSLNSCFIFLPLYRQPLFGVFFHLLRLSQSELALLVLM